MTAADSRLKQSRRRTIRCDPRLLTSSAEIVGGAVRRTCATDLGFTSDVEGMEHLPTDAELLQQSVLDPGAFGGLYERHGLAVRRFVVRRVGIADGEGLAAEVFVRAFRARTRYRAERDTALPWLLGVANYVISDHRRIERRRLAALERLLVEAQELAVGPDAGLRLDVVRALGRLPGPDRDTLLLLVWGGAFTGRGCCRPRSASRHRQFPHRPRAQALGDRSRAAAANGAHRASTERRRQCVN